MLLLHLFPLFFSLLRSHRQLICRREVIAGWWRSIPKIITHYKHCCFIFFCQFLRSRSKLLTDIMWVSFFIIAWTTSSRIFENFSHSLFTRTLVSLNKRKVESRNSSFYIGVLRTPNSYFCLALATTSSQCRYHLNSWLCIVTLANYDELPFTFWGTRSNITNYTLVDESFFRLLYFFDKLSIRSLVPFAYYSTLPLTLIAITSRTMILENAVDSTNFIRERLQIKSINEKLEKLEDKVNKLQVPCT